MTTRVYLKINSKNYTGWNDIVIKRSMTNLSGTFTVAVSEKHPYSHSDWEIRMGDPCSIEIVDEQFDSVFENTTVLNGYIDQINVSYGDNSHNIEFIGRDKTCDLVDCMYDGPTEFKDQTLRSMIKRICDDFDPAIELYVDPLVLSICNEKVKDNSVTINQGMTIYELIQDLCNSKGVLPLSYGDGKLSLTQAGGAGNSNDVLQLGYNVKYGAAELSNVDRYSMYTIKSQKKEDDLIDLVSTNNVQNSIAYVDKTIKRKRPFVKVIDNADIKTCNNYAQWIANYKRGMSRKYTYTVVDFAQSNGKPWGINTKVKVIDEQLMMDKVMLINDLEFIYNASMGSLVKIGVVDPLTYSLTDPSKVQSSDSEFDPKPHEASF